MAALGMFAYLIVLAIGMFVYFKYIDSRKHHNTESE